MAGLLIIDDDVETRQEIRLMMEDSPYNYLPVYEAGSAERGMLLLKQNQPGIVMLDLSLPDMDGMQLGKKVSELNPQVSIIILTHLKMFELVQAAINAGFFGYFLKPLSRTDLLAALDKLLFPDRFREVNYLGKRSSTKDFEVDLGNPIQSAIQFIHSDYSEPITLNEVANRVYLSASHFSRLFKAEMGVTFIEYLTKYRVDQSKRLLKMTSLPIEVIANNTGFANASYFATTFKRYEGKTPKEYRSLFSNLLHTSEQ